MNNITICVPTHKRPLMLKKLILSIIDCDIDKLLINDVSIIIVDNDKDKTAEIIVNEIKEGLDSTYKLHYFNHPVKGLSNVRNELLRRAIEINPDFIVFIDDDEYSTPEWLNELVTTIIVNNGDIVRGPVMAVLDKKVKKFISYWFERPNYQNNAKIKEVAAGNLIINLNSLLKYNVWFDNRFNYTGSEDFYFGTQMMKKGATIYWAANAIVYETIPESRANIKWLIKRINRGASTYMYVLKLEKKYLQILKKILVSLIYVIVGICATIILILPIKKKYWGIIKFYEGIGGLTGLLNIVTKEYK